VSAPTDLSNNKGFQVKNLCVMFVFAIVYFLFFSEYQFAVDIIKG
jgi:hypothetical protein